MNASQLDLELVIATYVLTTEGKNTTLVYLQEAEKVENLGAISYNDIPKEEEQEWKNYSL